MCIEGRNQEEQVKSGADTLHVFHRDVGSLLHKKSRDGATSSARAKAGLLRVMRAESVRPIKMSALLKKIV